MPATPKKGAVPRPAAVKPAALQEPNLWDLHIAPALDRFSLVLALLLVAIACARIISTYSEMSITSDEPAHFACGLEYLSQHTYKLEPQHPPLARAMTALGAYLDGLRPVAGTDFSDVGYKVLEKSGNPLHYVFLMRLGILPFFILGCAAVYFWTARQFGKAAAVFAVALFTTQPVVLAHAGLATTDMALATCLTMAYLALLAWAQSPTWPRALALSVTTTLAVLSKFSSLGYLPVTALFALVFYIGVKRTTWPEMRVLAVRRLPTFAAAVAFSAFSLWAAYWFSYGVVPGWNVRLPAPEMFDGILFAGHHAAGGHAAYLLGSFNPHGWWYFFPVALSVKTPIATLLLVAVGVYACRRRGGLCGLSPIAFALGILVPAMTSHINIGTRHVLPVYMSFSVLGAIGVMHLGRAFRGPALAAGVPALLLAWMVFSGARQHPDYLAYFNEFAGSEPDHILVDSDLDWGQEVVLLSRRLHELHAREVSVSFLQSPRYVNFYRKVYGLPPGEPFQAQIPNEGWNAVSPTVFRVTAGGGEARINFDNVESNGSVYVIRGPWYERMPPTEKVGGLLLYKIPPHFIPE